MQQWRSVYKHKLVSASQALGSLKSGERVVLGHACSEPPALVEAMVDRFTELSNVEVMQMVPMGPEVFAQPGMEQSFRFNGFFVGGPTRKAV
jgi:4-hydroxybutyrate CoA-transferase